MKVQNLHLFRLSKLGHEIPNEFFMDADGNVYEKVAGRNPNNPTQVRRLSMYWPALHERAKTHPDWRFDTKTVTL